MALTITLPVVGSDNNDWGDKINNALTAIVNYVNGLNASSIGLGNVDNTHDAVKNVLSATKLIPGANINGVLFDGTQAVTVSDPNAVPSTRTVNGYALSANIVLAAADVSAVPTTRLVNGHALSADVTLAPSDIAGLAAVATSGSYLDLNNTPSIPATAADVGAAPMVVATGASPIRFTGYGSALPTTGTQSGDVFFLT